MAQPGVERRILLIRAVNVGGAKVPMAQLREIAESLGAQQVSTYIASGNLICAPPGDPGDFDRSLEAAIEERFGFFREVISRTPAQLRAALAAHPFPIAEEKFSYIYPLTAEPAAERIEQFQARNFGSDQLRVIGHDLHIRYDEGAGASKLTAPVIAKGLGVTGTGRNVRTIGKLIELAADQRPA